MGTVRSVSVAVWIGLLAATSLAEETYTSSVGLPFAEMSQEVTYHPSKAKYEEVRDDTLARLRDGDKSAFVNPADGPWVRVETTSEVGLRIKEVGGSSGRKFVRQISAAEEALFVFEKEH